MDSLRKGILKKVDTGKKWARICKVYPPDEIKSYFRYRVEFTNKRGVVDQSLTHEFFRIHVWREDRLTKVNVP